MAQQPTESIPKKIKFDYIKSNLFRTAHADGAWAGTNGYQNLVLSFFSERTPIPTQTVHPLTEESSLGDEILAERKSRDAVVREVEIAISMSLDVAKSLSTLLTSQIRMIEAAKADGSKLLQKNTELERSPEPTE